MVLSSRFWARVPCVTRACAMCYACMRHVSRVHVPCVTRARAACHACTCRVLLVRVLCVVRDVFIAFKKPNIFVDYCINIALGPNIYQLAACKFVFICGRGFEPREARPNAPFAFYFRCLSFSLAFSTTPEYFIKLVQTTNTSAVSSTD